MSRFDDEREDDDFDSPGETDSVIRELRVEIIRLEAQLDQLRASARETAQEMALLAARIAVLEDAFDRLRARQKRDAKLVLLAWVMVALSLGMTLTAYLTS